MAEAREMPSHTEKNAGASWRSRDFFVRSATWQLGPMEAHALMMSTPSARI